MMIINVTNKDCSVHVDPFYNVVGLAKMMTLNKTLNAHAMKLLGKTYGKKVPTKGLMHMGRLLTARNQEIAKDNMLPGIKYADAAIRMKCMLCQNKCPSISEYGFVAHSKCIGKKEEKVTGSNTGGMMISELHHLKKRLKVWDTYAITEGIPGVFPHSQSLRGYTMAYPVEAAKAAEKAATNRRRKAQRKEKEATTLRIKAEKDERQGDIVKADIEVIFGVPSQTFFREKGYDTEDPMSYDTRKELQFVLRFETGQQCVDTLRELNKRHFSSSVRLSILRSEAGETISYREAMDRTEYCIRSRDIKEKTDFIKETCEQPFQNEEYIRLRGMLLGLKAPPRFWCMDLY